MATIREIFARNVVTLRGDRTIKEVAAASGVPYRTIQNMENGVIPQGDNLERISDFFGVPESRLFADPDVRPPPTVESLTRIIEDQERRIHTLEARLSQANQQVVPAQQDRGGARESRPEGSPSASSDRAELLELIASPALDDTQVSRTLRNLKTELAAIAGAAPHPRARKQSKEPM